MHMGGVGWGGVITFMLTCTPTSCYARVIFSCACTHTSCYAMVALHLVIHEPELLHRFPRHSIAWTKRRRASTMNVFVVLSRIPFLDWLLNFAPGMSKQRTAETWQHLLDQSADLRVPNIVLIFRPRWNRH